MALDFIGGSSQSERNLHIFLVFSSLVSIPKLFTRGSQGSGSDESRQQSTMSKMESCEKNQNGVLRIGSELFRV